MEERDPDNKVHFREHFDDFLKCLQEHEISTHSKFVVTESCKEFTSSKDSLNMKKKIRWQDNVPYLHFGTRTYACHQGRDTNLYQKKKYATERDRKACMDHNFTKRYNLTQVTKKLDCPASISVTRMLRFTTFKISEKKTEYEKKKASQKIKEVLNKEDIGEMGYLFNLPPLKTHQNHLKGPEASSIEPIDQRVRKQITKLVYRGERSAAVIKKIVTSYVENHLQEYDTSRRRFYPDLSSIRNIVYSVKSNIKNSPIDQENLEIILNRLHKDQHRFFFRPFKINNETNDEDNTFIDDKKLLLVYQSADMCYLYRKYGSNCILLDGTYRTCKYAIPLYFIVVETNVNFQIVGVLITQFETSEAITEGLAVFRSWNPDINPQHGMVDFAAEEISSLERVFPNIKVFICTFHREQAWHRWLSKSCHSGIPKTEALSYLRRIGNAPTIEEVETAIEDLRKWDVFQETDFKMYYEGTWHKEIQRWALAFKPDNMYQNTNNGVERQNKELKYGYLEGLKGCSLSELVEVLIKKFLPERYHTYVSDNVKMSPLARKYGDDLPSYLHGRPKWLIDHVMSKISLFSGRNYDIVVNTVEDGVFEVPSLSQDNLVYTVHVNEVMKKCSCTCLDYRKNRLLCKHIIFVGTKVPSLDLCAIHTWVFQNPIFCVDEEVLGNDEELPTGNVVNKDQDQSSCSDAINEIENPQSYNELPLRGSNKRHLINECNASMRSLQSVLWYLNESNLQTVSSKIKALFEEMSPNVEKDHITGLPIWYTTSQKQTTSVPANQQKRYEEAVMNSLQKERREEWGNLKLNPKKGLTGRVGVVADLIKQCSSVNVTKDYGKPEAKKRKSTF